MTRRRGHKVYALDDGTLVAANQELMTGDDQVGPTPGVPLTVTSLGGGSGVDAGAKNTIVLLGNSRIAREVNITGTVTQGAITGMFVWANARAGGRFNVVNVAGVSGQTLAQILARFDTDVVPYAPAWVLLADPVNDATASRTAAQMIADTQAIITRCKAIGAKTLLLTAPPNGGHTTAQRQALNDFNLWVKLSTDSAVVPIDVASVVTDPATGNYLTAMADGDALHQSPAGAARMARVIAATLVQLLPPRDPFGSPVDTTNAVVNPWMSGAVSGSAVPTGWTTTGTAVYGTVARTDLIPGNWAQIDTTGGVADAYVRQVTNPIPAAALAPGDTVRLTVEMQADALTSITVLQMHVQFRDASNNTLATLGAFDKNNAGAFPLADQPLSPDIYVFQSPPMVVPPLTTQFNLLDEFNGVGKVRFGRHRLAKA